MNIEIQVSKNVHNTPGWFLTIDGQFVECGTAETEAEVMGQIAQYFEKKKEQANDLLRAAP